MAKRRSKGAIASAKRFSQLLLWEASGGTMGTAPDNELQSTGMTFGEKRGLLDSLIKIATLEHKVTPDDEESGFDFIKKGFGNGGTKSGSTGNLGGAKSFEPNPDPIEPGTDDGEEDETEES